MKVGLMISIAVAVLFGVMLYVSMQGDLAAPTRRTDPQFLAAVSLPADPPALRPTAETDDDAAALYARAFDLYRHREAALSASPRPAEDVEALIDLLRRAAATRTVEAGFLDEALPVAMGAEPAFGDALESVFLVALEEADLRAEVGQHREAVASARALWILGRRAFEDNVRLYHRLQGHRFMGDVLPRLSAWADRADLDATGFDTLSAALSHIDSAWRPKLHIVVGVDPPIGDLIDLARHDQDRTFRVAAMLRLGVARFKPGSPANLDAINDAIADGAASDDSLIAAAAAWSANLTLDEMKRLR